jgi:hypothetical protein
MAWRLLFRCGDAEEAETTLAVLEGLRFAERSMASEYKRCG